MQLEDYYYSFILASFTNFTIFTIVLILSTIAIRSRYNISLPLQGIIISMFIALLSNYTFQKTGDLSTETYNSLMRFVFTTLHILLIMILLTILEFTYLI